MSVKLDTLELDIRSLSETGDSILELRTLSRLEIIDRRHVVELDIPGSSGNVLQDMGSDPVRIFIEGELIGMDAKKTLEQLRAKYDTNQPFTFYSDLSTAVAEVSKVLIEQLYVEEVAASVNRYKYYMTLMEYKEPKQQQEPAPEQQVQVHATASGIKGQFVWSDDSPAKGITVKINGPGGVREIKTDDQGYFQVEVPEGKYEITSDDPGFEDEKSEVEVKNQQDQRGGKTANNG